MGSEDRYKDFWADLVASHYLNPNRSIREVFIEERCELLVNQDILHDYHILGYKDDEQNIQIDAWGFLPTENSTEVSLAFIVCDFKEKDILESQTMTDFRKFLLKGKRFHTQSMRDDYYLFELTRDSPESALAEFLYKHKDVTVSIKIIGITNTKIVSRSNMLIINEDSNRDIVFYYDAWDFLRCEKIQTSKSGRESVDINFVQDYGLENGIPVLHTAGNTPDISSYLFVLPGETLASMYEQWNERILEQNPRTFLQFTGKVNKGIRNTLRNEPDKFFSYNNGISAVAEMVKINLETGNIEAIQDFQIVNGGQTTASIYNTMLQARKSKVPFELSKISVMVKLSVIQDPEKAERIIPKISEYSNSQNKVPISAFSVRHPYHKVIEQYSRNILTPSQQGSIETHWYYERVQGQYKNALNLKKTASEMRNFARENPKTQMFKREELAKYILTFDEQPARVCLGAQKAYARFCEEYLKTDEEGEGIVGPEINERYFKEICAKAIIFRMLEKRTKQDIRFVAVPYTLAFVNRELRNQGYVLDFQQIWKNQWKNDELINRLAEIMQTVIQAIRSSMPDEVTLPSEWGKKEICWLNFNKVSIPTNQLKEFSIFSSLYDNQLAESVTQGKEDRIIDALAYITEKGSKYWWSIENWGYASKLLDSRALGILHSATDLLRRIPSDKQAKAIIEIEKRALKEGFTSK